LNQQLDAVTRRPELQSLAFEHFEDADRSGKETSKRPGYLALMERVRTAPAAQVGAVAFYDADRLHRNDLEFFRFMAEMTERRILVFDGNGLISNVDRLSWKIKAIVAQEEREKVARRVRDNLRYLRRNGKLLGTIPAMGATKFILQLDDPAIAENWDQINPAPSVEAYKRFTRVRVEALNHAVRGLPPERIRFHLCWGSWHGPHVTDIPMADIVDLMLEINAGAYSFEAANVRHEHEWKIWQDVRLPDGKKILPGVVSHSTNVVEHPELVAERIGRFASGVGAENVIASTDCGLGGRVHPQIAWAKLDALAKGAQLAAATL